MGKIDLKTRIGKTLFKNPIWVASGTFGSGEEFKEFVPLEEIGAIVTKTVTLKKREGNSTPRVIETTGGMVNSIGLENKGVKHFIQNILPETKKYKTNIIVSIAGKDKKEIREIAKEVGKLDVQGIELNLSCPNVEHKTSKYKLMAQDPDVVREIIRAIRKIIKIPLFAKLTPNVTDISEIAKAAQDAGSDAVSLVNTFSAIVIDPYEMKPILGNKVGGLSGPAIKPMAIKAVWDVYGKIKIPIIGIGGIMTGLDVAEFMLAGASAVQVGTANLVDPTCYLEIKNEFINYLQEKKIKTAKDIVGKAKG